MTAQAINGNPNLPDGAATAIDSFDAHFRVGHALAERGLDICSLSPGELSELEEAVRQRLSPVLDGVTSRWTEEHQELSEFQRIDRELRQRIAAERDRLDRDYECEGCGYRHWDDDRFVDFHDLQLCDGCAEQARYLLRELQKPLIHALAAEPTLERARGLGFELSLHNGRLTWISEDEEFDGNGQSYADEREALECLIHELS